MKTHLFRPIPQALVLMGLFVAAQAAAQSSTDAENEAASNDQAASTKSGTQVSEQVAGHVSKFNGQVQHSKTLVVPKASLGDLDTARISEMQQAREVAEMQQELKNMQGLAEQKGSLTGPAGGLTGGRRGNDRLPGSRAPGDQSGNSGYENAMDQYGTGLQGNRDKSPNFVGGMPSSNPRDWMSGADGSVSIGSVETSTSGNKPRRDKYVKPYRDDKYVKPYKDNKYAKPDKPDKPVKPDKPDKPVVADKYTKPVKPDKPDKPDKGIAKTIDPNSDPGRNQGMCVKMPWTCNRGKPSRQTTLVNPGKSPDDTQQVVRINPGNSIVTNPVLEHARQGTPQTEEGIRRSIEGGTLIDPPNPDDPG